MTATQAPELIALKSKKERKEQRVTLFSIDGKEYDVPLSIRPNKGLQILHVFRQKGETAGVSFMLETLLGTDGYDALLAFDDLTEDQLEQIIKIAFELVSASATSDKSKNLYAIGT